MRHSPHLYTIIKYPWLFAPCRFVVCVATWLLHSEENVIVCFVVNANSGNLQAPTNYVIKCLLQRVLARHCVVHREQSYTWPKVFQILSERIFPTELRLNPINTLFDALLSERFACKIKQQWPALGATEHPNMKPFGGQCTATLPSTHFPLETAYLSRNARLQLWTRIGLSTMIGFF